MATVRVPVLITWSRTESPVPAPAVAESSSSLHPAATIARTTETITRTLTGTIFVALVILSLVLHPFAYLVLFSIICVLAWFEFSRMFPEYIPPVMRIPVAIYLAGSFIMILCGLTVIGTLISDILLAWSDPRIRYE